jgi:hypothetical protein
MRNTVWCSVLCASALTMVGCATSGIGSGQLQSAAGSTANLPVHFAWRADREPTRGTIQAVLPDGRSFEGEFIQVNSATTAVDLGPYWGGGWGPWGGYGYDAYGYARHYSGRVISQLRGPSNQRMRCEFQLARPEQGPVSGGQGQCQLSTGERIDYAELRGTR